MKPSFDKLNERIYKGVLEFRDKCENVKGADTLWIFDFIERVGHRIVNDWMKLTKDWSVYIMKHNLKSIQEKLQESYDVAQSHTDQESDEFWPWVIFLKTIQNLII